MDATVENILQRVKIPEDDGRLNEALADLNSKLAAWSGAIHHAQSSLRDILRLQTASETGELNFARVETIPEPLTHAEASQPSAPPEENVSVPSHISTSVTCEITETSVAAEAPVLTESAKSAEPAEDDEALLATLDPETAKRIQVLRRLSGQKKSVRELLEQHQKAAASPVPAQPSKRSFWRR